MSEWLEQVLDQESVVRTHWLPDHLAADEIVEFESQWGSLYLDFACHAALPLVVSPILLNLLRTNFFQGQPLPWVADADVMLSTLCRPLGEEYYQFEPRIRELLLVELEDRFGSRRPWDLGQFLLAYLQSPSGMKQRVDVSRTHRWIALAYTHPQRLLQEMTQLVEDSLHEGSGDTLNIVGQIHIATTIEMISDIVEQRLGKEPQAFHDLRKNARLMAYYWYGDREAVQRQAATSPFPAAPKKQEKADHLSLFFDWVKGEAREDQPEAKIIKPAQLPPAVTWTKEEEAEGIHDREEQLRKIAVEWAKQFQAEYPTLAYMKGKHGNQRAFVLRHLAEAMIDRCPDGQIYVDLLQQGTTDELVEAVLIHVLQTVDQSASAYTSLDMLMPRYQEIFGYRQVLIVIDNLDTSQFQRASREKIEDFILGESVQESMEVPRQEMDAMLSPGEEMESLFSPWQEKAFSLSPDLMKVLSLIRQEIVPAQGNRVLLVSDSQPADLSDMLYLDLDAELEHLSEKSKEGVTSQEGGVVIIHNKGMGKGFKDTDDIRQILQRFKSLGFDQPLAVWNETRLHTESNGRREFEQALEQAQAVIILLTPEFLNAWELHHIVQESMHHLLSQQFPQRLFPILLEQCEWERVAWLHSVQLWPRSRHPLRELDDGRQMFEWQQIISEVQRVLQEPSPSHESTKAGQENKDKPKILQEREETSSDNLHTGPVESTIRIFLSYRHEDASHYGSMIHDRLNQRGHIISHDIDTIDLGVNFQEEIERTVRSCDVLIVVIGLRWSTTEGQQVRKRLDNPSDIVRLEIETALIRNIPIVPVLVEGATMPTAKSLPESLRALSRYHALILSDATFLRDLAHLEKMLEKVVTKKNEKVDSDPILESADEATISSINPPSGMILIPKGFFLFGSNKQRTSIEYDYFMDLYLVTNIAYAKFIEAGCYDNKYYWSVEGWEWRDKANVTQPAYWEVEKWNKPAYPVVGVSYYEAEAYAQWIGKRLPTEEEWEKAARGKDGTEYPWGERFDVAKCNCKESRLERTTRVTKYSNGMSPYGCYDMAGNVWEWCLYDEKKSLPVVRGGSWGSLPRVMRAWNRSTGEPTDREDDLGFRLVQDIT